MKRFISLWLKNKKKKTNQLHTRPPGLVTKTMVIAVPYHWLSFPLLACTLSLSPATYLTHVWVQTKFYYYLFQFDLFARRLGMIYFISLLRKEKNLPYKTIETRNNYYNHCSSLPLVFSILCLYSSNVSCNSFTYVWIYVFFFLLILV